MSDPLERARIATHLMALHGQLAVEMGAIRREAVEELQSLGWSLTDIAHQIGVPKRRLSQKKNRKEKENGMVQ